MLGAWRIGKTPGRDRGRDKVDPERAREEMSSLVYVGRDMFLIFDLSTT